MKTKRENGKGLSKPNKIAASNSRAKLQEALEALGTLTQTMQEKENQNKLRIE